MGEEIKKCEPKVFIEKLKFNSGQVFDFESNLYLLKHTKCAAVLTENMFQDSLSDVSFLQSHSGMEAITMLHVEGIREYLAR